ncbi:Ribulose bisphosphate carboxylase/oxygenase activase, chloroplastic [Tetrabaena socialis]|uniref:Ribulose bisphosphate carboxylase/oxygenase activase, chloroplastic n=1 Tax=Tetrabaena socialis TaxID=47790 RepID=A0A2J7ZU66_9CHLO|nr:Ribulose bisphosphate carboxylase/oxygenase activase, chloroplastic [Tetrabaena socialis]|eukprot:PNH03817.1 Ribulose bisphosphate carboxylase/oxygenase activase, chloroplastic [Tetrabaena socialis]
MKGSAINGQRVGGAPAVARGVRRAQLQVVASKSQVGRWRSIDAGVDTSDDQQDISRGREMVDDLFQGGFGQGGTHNAVLSSTDYLSAARKSFNNIEDGFYISPSFLDKMTIHIAKNFIDLPKVKVPLILGIWGGKGQGKTFQCSLAYKKLAIQPIVMSAGELESGNAGEPAKLVRQRYREVGGPWRVVPGRGEGGKRGYYWNPSREDRIGVCMGIFQEDAVDRQDIENLVDTFPGQSIDFFGALRARVYDDLVRKWIGEIGIEGIGMKLVNNRNKVQFPKASMNLDILMKYGRALVDEQENVKRVQLADAYLSGAELAGNTGSSLPETFKAR